MAGGVEVAKAFVTIVPSMQGAQDEITDQLVPAAKGAGNKAGTAASGGIMSGLSKFAVPAAVIGAIVEVGKVAYEAFQEVEEGANNVIKATGATGKAADDLIKTYKDVAKSVVGDFDDIGAAVGELNTRFGLVGTELEAAGEQTMKFAKVTGLDATKAVQSVARMMNSAGIPASQYASVLDKLTVAGQQAGIDVGKLADSVTANAAAFSAMGFSTDEAIAMLASFEKAGVNSSKVISGMNRGIATWTKEGKSAAEGFSEFVAGVQDGSITMQDAMDIFGTRAGAAMYDAAQKGQLSFDEMYEAITGDSSGALDQVYSDTLTVGEKLELIGNNVKLALADAVEPLVDGLSVALTDYVIPAFQEAIPKIQEFFTQVAQSPIVQELISAFQELGPVLSDDGGYFKEVVELLKELRPVLELVTMGIVGNIRMTKTIIAAVWPVISGIVTNSVRQIRLAIVGIKTVVNGVKGTFLAIKNAIAHPIETARSIIEGAIARIKSLFSGLHFELPSIKLPHFSISGGEAPFGIGGYGSLPEFSVEWYAKGGIFSAPSIIGVGEAGTEVVAPLDRLEAMIDKDNDAKIVTLLEALVNKDSNVYLDGRELVNSTVGYTDTALGYRQALNARGLA